ncbi:hypothetical protein JHK82_033819 [Glycine max]|nr:hypothetical protein JHK85_034535 [Glycine max]KAG5119399.1 hypothetical protein JHK82_033819 [Glycine max]
MRVFFVAIVVDSNNFTLKGTEIVILEQLLVDILGVPNEKKRPLSLAASKSHWIVPNNYIPKENIEVSPQNEEANLEEDPFEPLDYGFFHETSEQISKENKKDEEDHSEPQNKVLAADKGGQLAQNEEAEIQKSFKKAKKVAAATAKTSQIAPKVTVSKRTHVRSVKDSLFYIENMHNLFISSIFDTYLKIACGLGPLHGEPLTFTIPFPQSPFELAIADPSKVQEEVPTFPISSSPLTIELPSRLVEGRLNSGEK